MRINRLIILALITSCKVATSTTSSTYTEDLSIHRSIQPIYTEKRIEKTEQVKELFTPLEGHIKFELDSIMKISDAINKEGKYVDGYMIQVYSGTSRDNANTARFSVDKLFPELNWKVSYHQPTFRVRGGRFSDRLEAHRIYKAIKEQFPRALLIPERFFLQYE